MQTKLQLSVDLSPLLWLHPLRHIRFPYAPGTLVEILSKSSIILFCTILGARFVTDVVYTPIDRALVVFFIGMYLANFQSLFLYLMDISGREGDQP